MLYTSGTGFLAYIYMYAYIHIYTYMHTYIPGFLAYIYIYAYIHIYTYMQHTYQKAGATCVKHAVLEAPHALAVQVTRPRLQLAHKRRGRHGEAPAPAFEVHLQIMHETVDLPLDHRAQPAHGSAILKNLGLEGHRGQVLTVEARHSSCFLKKAFFGGI